MHFIVSSSVDNKIKRAMFTNWLRNVELHPTSSLVLSSVVAHIKSHEKKGMYGDKRYAWSLLIFNKIIHYILFSVYELETNLNTVSRNSLDSALHKINTLKPDTKTNSGTTSEDVQKSAEMFPLRGLSQIVLRRTKKS